MSLGSDKESRLIINSSSGSHLNSLSSHSRSPPCSESTSSSSSPTSWTQQEDRSLKIVVEETVAQLEKGRKERVDAYWDWIGGILRGHDGNWRRDGKECRERWEEMLASRRESNISDERCEETASIPSSTQNLHVRAHSSRAGSRDRLSGEISWREEDIEDSSMMTEDRTAMPWNHEDLKKLIQLVVLTPTIPSGELSATLDRAVGECESQWKAIVDTVRRHPSAANAGLVLSANKARHTLPPKAVPPKKSTTLFNDEEDCHLLKAVRKYGANDFGLISRKLKGLMRRPRSNNSLRKRYQRLQKEGNVEERLKEAGFTLVEDVMEVEEEEDLGGYEETSFEAVAVPDMKQYMSFGTQTEPPPLTPAQKERQKIFWEAIHDLKEALERFEEPRRRLKRAKLGHSA